jgi:hypothetical protein
LVGSQLGAGIAQQQPVNEGQALGERCGRRELRRFDAVDLFSDASDGGGIAPLVQRIGNLPDLALDQLGGPQCRNEALLHAFVDGLQDRLPVRLIAALGKLIEQRSCSGDHSFMIRQCFLSDPRILGGFGKSALGGDQFGWRCRAVAGSAGRHPVPDSAVEAVPAGDDVLLEALNVRDLVVQPMGRDLAALQIRGGASVLLYDFGEPAASGQRRALGGAGVQFPRKLFRYLICGFIALGAAAWGRRGGIAAVCRAREVVPSRAPRLATVYVVRSDHRAAVRAPAAQVASWRKIRGLFCRNSAMRSTICGNISGIFNGMQWNSRVWGISGG